MSCGIVDNYRIIHPQNAKITLKIPGIALGMIVSYGNTGTYGQVAENRKFPGHQRIL